MGTHKLLIPTCSYWQCKRLALGVVPNARLQRKWVRVLVEYMPYYTWLPQVVNILLPPTNQYNEIHIEIYIKYY